jgi:predicted DNA-binding protein (MmcQ/YjbR family)
MVKQRASQAALKELRQFGLGFPGAHLKSPWPDHLDLAVNDKTFAYLSAPGEPFAISCKLPQSNALALALPFTEPTSYGLGKSGWVTAKPPEGEAIPLDLFKAWIDESYHAQAPKKLSSAHAPKPAAKQKPSAKAKTAAKAKPRRRAKRT